MPEIGPKGSVVIIPARSDLCIAKSVARRTDIIHPSGIHCDRILVIYCFTNVTGTLITALPPDGGSNCALRARALTHSTAEPRLPDAAALTL
jgi:hypothetical protein